MDWKFNETGAHISMEDNPTNAAAMSELFRNLRQLSTPTLDPGSIKYGKNKGGKLVIIIENVKMVEALIPLIEANINKHLISFNEFAENKLGISGVKWTFLAGVNSLEWDSPSNEKPLSHEFLAILAFFNDESFGSRNVESSVSDHLIYRIYSRDVICRIVKNCYAHLKQLEIKDQEKDKTKLADKESDAALLVKSQQREAILLQPVETKERKEPEKKDEIGVKSQNMT